MSIPYSIREGLAGFKRAKFATVAATSAMAVALILIGLFAVVTFEAQSVATWLRQRVGEVELFLDEVDEPIARALHERAAATPGVDEAEYITKEQAGEIFTEAFGDEGVIYQDTPFLPASIKVRVESDYANPDSLQSLVAEFNSWNRVDEVVFNQDLLAKVEGNLDLLTMIGLALGTLVVLASIFLVANTIRLTIYARRLLIRTMKLVGATDSFIRRPFIIEGLLQGVSAGLLAGLLIWFIHGAIESYVEFTVLSPGSMVTLFAGLCACGALLGWMGSFFSVGRFIRNVALH